tara:strand:+ start:5012 stop:5392 length:381 start_codon:yes stop_codon:yes gene_type:complete
MNEDFYRALAKRARICKRELQEMSRRKVRGYNAVLRAIGKGAVTFRVEISSSWKDVGEKDVVLEGQDDLGEVMARADEEFSRVNRRVDGQRGYEIHVISGSAFVEVPRRFYDRIVRDLARKREIAV